MIKKARTISKFWAPFLCWVFLIFILSSIPGSRIPKISIAGFDKIGHIFIYSVFGFLLIRAVTKTSNISLTKAVILSVIIASIYGISDEWYQSFVPGRTADKVDFFADFVGVGMGIFLYNRKEKRNADNKTV